MLKKKIYPYIIKLGIHNKLLKNLVFLYFNTKDKYDLFKKLFNISIKQLFDIDIVVS